MSLDRRKFLTNTGLTLAGLAALADSRKGFPASVPEKADLSSWSGVREQFGLSPKYVHLATFFLASHPRPVHDAIENYRKALDLNPFEIVEESFFKQPWQVEKSVAEYVGGKPEEIALTSSTTMGLALVYHGIPIKAGQEILTTEHDHYAHHESIRFAAERAGATVKKIPLFTESAKSSEQEIVARLKKAITPKTRAVGVTWVHSSSGLKLPIRSIAAMVAEANKNRADADRVLLVVDGVHGFGVENESAAQMGADFFAAGTHKWIFGPRGTGIVWGKLDMWRTMKPVIPSVSNVAFGAWMFGADVNDPEYQKRAAAFLGRPVTGMDAEWFSPGGFDAFEHRWAMPAAFEFHKQIGRARVAERIHTLNDQAKEGLAKMPKVKLHTPRGRDLSAGIICFEVEGITPAKVVEKLLAKNVIASTSPYRVTYARLAPSLLNTPEEIDRVLGYIREMA